MVIGSNMICKAGRLLSMRIDKSLAESLLMLSIFGNGTAREVTVKNPSPLQKHFTEVAP